MSEAHARCVHVLAGMSAKVVVLFVHLGGVAVWRGTTKNVGVFVLGSTGPQGETKINETCISRAAIFLHAEHDVSGFDVAVHPTKPMQFHQFIKKLFREQQIAPSIQIMEHVREVIGPDAGHFGHRPPTDCFPDQFAQPFLPMPLAGNLSCQGGNGLGLRARVFLTVDCSSSGQLVRDPDGTDVR